MSTPPGGTWDFNDWMELASSDPEAFEARREEAIEALIEDSPAERRHRLRCLQWRIDRVRERSSSPLAGCISVYEMMWDSLLGDGGLVEALHEAAGATPRRPQRTAQVVTLSPRTPQN
ncbi:MAG: hypothetical protein Kow006_07530 [Gammaproteobacteria bacterium]